MQSNHLIILRATLSADTRNAHDVIEPKRFYVVLSTITTA